MWVTPLVRSYPTDAPSLPIRSASQMARVLTRFTAGGDVGFGRRLRRAGNSKQSALFAADQPTSWPYMSHS